MVGLKRKIFLVLVVVGLCAVIVIHQSTKHATIGSSSPAVEKNLRFMEDKGTVENDQGSSVVSMEQKEKDLRDRTESVPSNKDDGSKTNTEKKQTAEDALQLNNATSLIVDTPKEKTATNMSNPESTEELEKNSETKELQGNAKQSELAEDSVVVEESPDLCPEKNPLLVGPLKVDQAVPTIESVEKEMAEKYGGWVEPGGKWRPEECKARSKVAIIIPYRKRYEQLLIFLRHMHPMLRRQQLDYRIFVIEQAGQTPFNRAMLFNIGYAEAIKLYDFGCFIFHDVDLIPEDDRNSYGCPLNPRHMSVAVDKFNYKLPYHTIFGGVGAFNKAQFELINGFSNKFWGWGGEDDDLYKRITAKHLNLVRPSITIGRYKMVRIFHKSAAADPERMQKLRDSNIRMLTDGINSLKYNKLSLVEHSLYTTVTVDINRWMV